MRVLSLSAGPCTPPTAHARALPCALHHARAAASSLAGEPLRASSGAHSFPRSSLTSQPAQRAVHGPPPPGSYAPDMGSQQAQAPDDNSGFIGEVDWSPELANSVSLIGNTGSEVDVRYLSTGNSVARVNVAVSRGKASGTTDWFEVELWGPLGQQAAQQLPKGSRVLVQGRLRTDEWVDKNSGAKRKATKVVASTVQRVRSLMPLAAMDPDTRLAAAMQPAHAAEAAAAAAPHGEGGAVTVGAPQAQDVVPQMPSAGSDAPWEPRLSADPTNPTHAKWLAFFADPNAWWDNRTTKRNPKGPDFKQKAGDEALWLDSRDTPAWVQEQLSLMDDDADIPF